MYFPYVHLYVYVHFFSYFCSFEFNVHSDMLEITPGALSINILFCSLWLYLGHIYI